MLFCWINLTPQRGISNQHGATPYEINGYNNIRTESATENLNYLPSHFQCYF